MTPIIGITTYGRDEKNHYTLPAEYVDAVNRAGGTPILLPPGEHAVDRWLATVDGVILAGGGDMNPELYDGDSHETIYMIDAERDGTEMMLAKRLLESSLPTLGICRGTQLINVALGGTLHNHLPDVVGEDVLHRLPPREPTPHRIAVTPGSKLAGVTQSTDFEAASWHHQAIDRVAAQLSVVAHAPDGVVEAVEKPDHPWLVAVQWHPELTAKDDPIQQRIFDNFVAACAASGGR